MPEIHRELFQSRVLGLGLLQEKRPPHGTQLISPENAVGLRILGVSRYFCAVRSVLTGIGSSYPIAMTGGGLDGRPTPMIDVRRNSPTRARCWTASAVLALGLPAAIWIVSKLLSLCLPGMAHGSTEQRFLLWISGPALVEWLFVLFVWLLLRARASSFAAIGVWRFGTWPGWLIALLFGALSIASNLRFLPMLHIPISQAFWPRSTFHLLTALLVGITAGFCEEVLFRAFLMTEFAEVGYGKLMQVIAPGIAFGLSHAGYLNQGFLPWLGIMLPTAFLGMMWGVGYLLGRRALVPAIVAHFLNDATALHWIAFYMMLPR